jgi:2'-5' RNA ligase
VLWVGIAEGAQELRALASKLSQSLSAAGLFFEDRFEPHVTIGRVKGSLPETFMRRMAGYVPQKRAVSRLASVDLMQSELTSDGPVYRRVSSRLLL